MTCSWEDLENEEYMYRIMIVEDDEVIASAIWQHLVSWGMEAFCVQDFSDVLTEFAATSPQLVLMDIHLPFFNGYHWCQEIRKVSKHRCPVLLHKDACQKNLKSKAHCTYKGQSVTQSQGQIFIQGQKSHPHDGQHCSYYTSESYFFPADQKSNKRNNHHICGCEERIL